MEDYSKEKILQILESHIKIRNEKKQQFGEVLTPISVIDSIYNEFPKDVWKNKDLKWLEPSSGVGNFTVILFYKLMKGLEDIIKNPKERANHIVSSMIYMIEIDEENVKTCLNIFHTLCPSTKPNIWKGNFLDISSKDGIALEHFPKEFDIILGNPPYNTAGTKRKGIKRVHVIFTERSLQSLKPQGILSFICPPNYRESNSIMNSQFLNKKGSFLFIKIYSSEDTYRIFKIQARVDAFIYKKGAIREKTKIIDEFNIESHIKLDLTDSIPNFGYSIFDKLKKKVLELGYIKGHRTTEMTTVDRESFSAGKHKLLHLIISEGRRIIKVSKKHSLEEKPKIFINGLGVPYVFYDKKGEYGCTQVPIVILNPTDTLSNLLQTKLFNFIAWGLRLTGNNNLPYILKSVPDIRNDISFKKKDINQYLSLTKKEIEFIEKNFIVPSSKDKNLNESIQKTRKNKLINIKTRKIRRF